MKKIICMFFMAAVLAALCACGKMQETPSNSGNQQAAQTPRGDSGSQSISKHMTETLCDGFEIDADIPVPVSSALSTYQAKPFHISSDDAVSLLVKESEREIETNQKDSDDPNGFKLKLKNGIEIYHQSGRLLYWSETADKDDEIFDLLFRYKEKHIEEETHILSFMSPQEAIKQGEDLIDKLDIIGESVVQTIVGLSSEDIMAWQSALLKDDNYKSWTDIGKTWIFEDLTDEDDAYLISFSFIYSDVHVFNQDIEPGVTSASDNFSPMSMKVDMLITAKGLRYFSLQNALNADGNTSESQNLISSEQALQKLIGKYENTITFGTQCIIEVWLEYIPISDPNSHSIDAPVTLKPYWCFGMIDTELGREYGIVNAERINAITGDDFTYGG